MKVLAKVRFGWDPFVYALDKSNKFKYYRTGDIMYGTNGLLYTCYGFERNTARAFAGHKFDIKLETGEVIQCRGDWWHKNVNKISEIVGRELSAGGFASVEQLRKCYSFTGYEVDSLKLKEMLELYKGETYAYNDYHKVLMFDIIQDKYQRKSDRLENRVKSLIKVVKEKHQVIKYVEKYLEQELVNV